MEARFIGGISSKPPPSQTPPWPGTLSEAMDCDLSFVTSGDDGNRWFYDDDAFYDCDSVDSGSTSDNEEVYMLTVVDVNDQETLTFYWKVSSEEDSDYLEFYIDDVREDRISGEVGWQKKTYDVNSTGYHTLKWRYVKDGSGSDGSDRGWVDYVQWTGPSPVQDPENWENITYKYDTGGRRTEKRVDGYSTRYLYDGGNVIAEYDGNGNLLRKYIHGPCIDEPICMLENPASDGIDVAANNAVYYYHYDALGSVVALSDSDGDSCQSYEYSVYGQVAASDPNFITNPYMFIGRRFDIEIRRPGAGRAGLYYNRARYYNPYTGRFLQADPIGYGDGMNMYAYCGNNSLAFTDPTGQIRFGFEILYGKGTDGIWGYVATIDGDLYALEGPWNGAGLSSQFEIAPWNFEIKTVDGIIYFMQVENPTPSDYEAIWETWVDPICGSYPPQPGPSLADWITGIGGALWEGAVEGAAATADGFIPFADPFEYVYVNPDGSVDGVFKFSQICGGVSRDLFIMATAPNLAEWAKHPIQYMIGNKTLPSATYKGLALDGLSTMEKYNRIVAAQGGVGNALIPQWGAYHKTIFTGLTPGARAGVIAVVEYLDHDGPLPW